RLPTSPLFPYSTLFRSAGLQPAIGNQQRRAHGGEGRSAHQDLDREGRRITRGGEENPAEEAWGAQKHDRFLPKRARYLERPRQADRKSTRLNSSHDQIS